MSEQKYYVRLKSHNNHLGIWWCGDRSEWQLYSRDPVYGEELEDFGEREVIGWKVSKYIPSFTKSELAEIMDGALYKSADYCEFMELPPDWVMNDKADKWLCEWINPLIELVPVEGNE